MPIEIRELIIKAEVAQGGGAKSAAPKAAPGAKGGGSKMDINEIVSLVFERIKEKLER